MQRYELIRIRETYLTRTDGGRDRSCFPPDVQKVRS